MPTPDHLLDARRKERRGLRRRQFGDRLRDLRLARGLTQEQLALVVGIDRTHVVAVERGYRSLLLDRVYEIADALEVEPAELLRPPSQRTGVVEAGDPH